MDEKNIVIAPWSFMKFSGQLPNLRIPILSAVCALAQIRLLQASGMDTNLTFGMDVVWKQNGWPGYRSRLLGPALIHLLGGNLRAFLIVTFVALVIGGLLSWRLAGPAGLGIYHAGFALVATPWFSPWDMLDPVFFTAFVIFVVEMKPHPWFIALFAVAIFNLQSAMFIALWMILSRQMIVPGLVCMLAGTAIMWFLQHSGQPKLGLFAFNSGYGTDYAQERVLENLRNQGWLTAGISAVIVGAAIAVMQYGYMALGLTYLALLAATMLFGIVTETRVYLDFIPLLILAAKGGPSSSAASGTNPSTRPST